jgi:hypothetical protein
MKAKITRSWARQVALVIYHGTMPQHSARFTAVARSAPGDYLTNEVTESRTAFRAASLAVLLLATGCQTTQNGVYQPSHTPVPPHRQTGSITMADVIDQRGTKPPIYYQNSINGDCGQYDRPVAQIVFEAVQTEWQRAGFRLTDLAASDVLLRCEVIDWRATITETFWGAATLDLCVAVVFEWQDPRTQTLLARNERSERRSRKLGLGNTPSLPFDSVVIKDYGNELMNDLLPRVIEEELRACGALFTQNQKPPAQSVSSLDSSRSTSAPPAVLRLFQ